MPQIEAAKKALRVSQRRRTMNDRWRRRLRDHVRAVRDAIAANDHATATKAYDTAVSTIDRATRRHILNKSAAARRKSRLSRAVNALKKS